ncbi:MAG: DUF4388 domain-containing protein [Desulfatitalea sp.]|nr:DUF4388 domain-containing protein [Desulfatitalea sp.]NNJ98955.1 DUF4388 domain-containing protein [Desulfatitalea sp.]
MKTILYLEEKPHIRENFIRMIDRIGFFRVLSAGTAVEAIEIAEKIRVDMIIIGRQVNAREMDVLDRQLKQNKNIKLIAMANRKSPLANILKAFEYKIQFETPLDINLFMETLLSEFELNCGGQLKGVSIASFLQMISLEGKSCTIQVLAKGKTGHLYCESGQLIDAEIEKKKGIDAVYDIISMENPTIVLEHDLPERERTVNHSMMSLLLESGRRLDEKAPEHEEHRRYKRFECSLPVSFYYGEGVYKGKLKNISLNGVFLVTKGPFVVGKEVHVALYSPSLDKACRMPGVIIRKQDNGIGIEFTLAGINHMAILRTVIHEVQHDQNNPLTNTSQYMRN